MLRSDLVRVRHAHGTHWKWRTRDEKRLHANRVMRTWLDVNKDWANLTRSCRKLGITIDQYHAMNESQDFLCAICGEEVPRLVIDHDHGTGLVRGLLCGQCNTGIGQFQESVERLIAAGCYIERHRRN